MIIKKPYAFLIKHFRIIHLILTVLVIFLLTKTHSIYKFFSEYAKNGYYAYSENISSKYINFYMFIAIIGVIVITSFIYLLMKWKKKSRVFYITLCLFYFALFIGLLVYFNLFSGILNTTLDIRAIRAYRDIIFILYVPQYFFLIYSIVRASGFDIKKFDFKKDLEELDIAEEDQEEIEVVFGQNAYKYKRKARRAFRMLKYYALENKFFFGVICGTLCLVIGFLIYINMGVYSKKYKESEFFTVNGVVFRVLDSYVSNVDLKGDIINPNMKYVVIRTSMENTNAGRVNLSTESLRLMLDEEAYYPIYSKSDYFRDFGEGYYKNNTLYAGEKYEYLIIFEVPLDREFDRATFRMIDDVDVLRGEIAPRYKDVRLSLKDYIEIKDTLEYKVGDAISLEDTTLNKSELMVNTYQLGESFIEMYKYCVGESCFDGKKIITADTLGKNNRTILKIELDPVLDSELYINKYIKNSTDFMKAFGSISYVINGQEKAAPIAVKGMDNIETKNVYIEVPDEIKNASLIKLNVNIRNRKFIINLAY